MTAQAEQVLKDVLTLSPIERAEMVERILGTFEFPGRKGSDAAWAREAEERIDAYERGDIKATAASKVFEKIGRQYSS